MYMQGQGQTFEAAGLYLGTDFFSHGQVYVAFSRVGNPDNIKVLMVKPDIMNLHFDIRC